MREKVVLVDDWNRPVGTADKIRVHGGKTPLHRGFSVFLFNSKGQLLLQRRSLKKKTWPGVWSNSCCGHPAPGESTIAAAKRRLRYELGISKCELYAAIPDYRYRAKMHGIVENEICPVVVGFTNRTPHPRTDEVESVKWVDWLDFLDEIVRHPKRYSMWSVEEALLLEKIRPVVVVSRCLNFEHVRYDGKSIRFNFIKKLARHATIVPVCPEVEIGLGVPRDPIKIVFKRGGRALVQPSTGRDLTATMNRFTEKYLRRIGRVDGFILKSKSPSCGISIPGFFADKVLRKFRGVPIVDELELEKPTARKRFLKRIFSSGRIPPKLL